MSAPRPRGACHGCCCFVTITSPSGRHEAQADEDGTHHVGWLSGPNPGYGFSIGSATTFVPVGAPAVARPEMDDAALEREIRGFLAQVDPDTGYLPD